VETCGRCNRPKKQDAKDGEVFCECGRPTKLTPEFLAAAEAVLAKGDNVIILTDEELMTEINETLPEDQRIAGSTFEAWKSAAKSGDTDEMLQKFLGVIKRALNREKKAFFKELRTGEKAWQRWAWIIERKFDEWNIKRKVEKSVTVKKDGAAVLAAGLLSGNGVNDGEEEETAA
jgi:uncharacterized Zn finger protein (UPF0148 family)